MRSISFTINILIELNCYKLQTVNALRLFISRPQRYKFPFTKYIFFFNGGKFGERGKKRRKKEKKRKTKKEKRGGEGVKINKGKNSYKILY